VPRKTSACDRVVKLLHGFVSRRDNGSDSAQPSELMGIFAEAEWGHGLLAALSFSSQPEENKALGKKSGSDKLGEKRNCIK